MRVYVFGNRDLHSDNSALNASNQMKEIFKEIDFIEVKPNQDLPFKENENVVIMDTVDKLKSVEVITDLDNVKLSPSSTVHDFDLGFQLKYLKKIGKIGSVTIIGVPREGGADYFLIHSILRKLVAQDIHGS